MSVLSAGTHSVAWTEGTLFASVLLAGIAAFGTLTTERRRQSFGAWLVLVGLAMGGYGVAQKVGYGFTLRVSESQVSSTFFNPSHYTGFVTLALPVALWAVFFHRNLLVKLLGLLAAGAMAYTLAYTDSSSLPTTMLAAAGAVTVWLWRLWRPAGVLLAAILLVGSIGIARVVTDPSQAARLDAIAHSLGLNNTVGGFLKGRRPLWKLDAKAAAAAPLTGVGPGGFIHFAPRFRPERRDETAGSTFNLVNYAHNDYYQMWVELGLPGLALYLLVIAATLLAATRTDPLGATIAIALACLWLSGLWDGHATVIPGTMAWAWMLTGIAARPSSLPVPAATA